jgi:flagellar hook-basal body complex protein FliE
MDIRAISAPGITMSTGAAAPTEPGDADSFGQLLAGALGALQHSLTEADTMTGALAAGQDVDLHEVVLSLEQADLATQLAVQVRNKLVEAYQEIARMQV